MPRLSKHIIAATLLCALVAAAAPHVAALTIQEPQLASHKALYEASMKRADPGAGLNGVSGKMYYEQDETCDAWTVEHRFTTAYQYADARPVIDTSHYIAFETKDGKQFNFNARREQDGEMSDRLRGTAKRNADGTGIAAYSRPEGTSYNLPQNYLLPSAQTLDTIRRAMSGETFFSVTLFDGTDEDGPIEVSTFILGSATPAEIKALAGDKIDSALLTPRAWHVRTAVFPLIDAAESTPAYEMESLLHDNGVISHALVDYGTFTVEQKLTALEKLPAPKKCD